jgi:hypothetical protein
MVLKTICPGWLQTMILLISASWVARITDVSHRPSYVFISWDKFSLLSPGWPRLALQSFHFNLLGTGITRPGCRWLFVVGLSRALQMFSSIPSLYPLSARSNPSFKIGQPKTPAYAAMVPGWEPLIDILSFLAIFCFHCASRAYVACLLMLLWM